jgi:hypothetical protein
METKLEYNETVTYTFADLKKYYESVRREEFYRFLREFAVPTKEDRFIKICVN